MRSPGHPRQEKEDSLFNAISKNNITKVKKFIRTTANLDSQFTNKEVTPLYLAVQIGNLDIVEALLEANANPSLPRNDGSTPLQLASFKGNLEIVKAIIEKKDQDWNLPNLMFLALLNNKFDFLEEFYKQIYR